MIKTPRLNKILKELKKKFKSISKLGFGKRGVVYLLNNKFIAKIERDDIDVKSIIKNEYDVLKIISKYKYFPKPISYNTKLRYVIREFVPGDVISDVFDKEIFIKCLKMCRVLDKEHINQTELTNPFKHIYVYKKNVMMIDFERAKKTTNPKNVSQFVQYLMKRYNIIDKRLIKLTKKYKSTYNKNDFKNIISYFISSF